MVVYKKLRDYITEPGNVVVEVLEGLIGQSTAGSVIVAQNLASLNVIDPEFETAGGWVLDDPDVTKNGYYYRSGGLWVKGRSFSDTLVHLTVSGGTGNAITATVADGIDASSIVAAIIIPTTTNTGPVTINAVPVLDISGDPLTAGAFTAGVAQLLSFDGSEYRIITGPTGVTGKSAYEIAVDEGFVGDEAAWLASLQGIDGTDGQSTYELAVAHGFVGDEAAFLESLVGPVGPEGPTGTNDYNDLDNLPDLSLKADLASPTFTGTVAIPTVAGTSDSTTKAASTAFVQAVAALKANLASPTFTGTPAAPTATLGTNTTQLATTAFVAAGLSDKFRFGVISTDASVPGSNFSASANVIGISTNTSGSTNFPTSFGVTLSFMIGSAGRAFDIWKSNGGGEDWHIRAHVTDTPSTTFGPWRRLMHEGAKASTSQATTATDDTYYMTALKSAQQADGRTSKIHGTDSIARTMPARFGDTIDLREWFDRTGSSGTDTANNTAFAALITYLSANTDKVTLRGHKGDVYRISGNTTRSFPNVGRLMMDGARFDWTGTLGASTSPVFSFNTGWDVEGMEFRVLSGATVKRVLDFVGTHKIDDVYVYADSQIANSDTLLDYAVRILRHDNRVRNLKVKKFDKAIIAYGADGDGVPGLGNRFEDVSVEDYLTGFELRNLKDCRNIGYRCKGRSGAAASNPGENGLLHSGIADYVLMGYKVENSGEHGIRFGGTRNSEQLSRRITVGPGVITRSAQCGLKFFTGTAGQRFIGVAINGVNVIDCQYEPERPLELPGFNDEGFLLQQIIDGMVTGCSVSYQDNPTGFSSDCCMFITSSQDLRVVGFRGSKPKRNLLRIAEYDDGAGSSPVETLANNSISFVDAYGYDIGEDGVYIDHPTQSVRDLNIHVDMIGTGATGFYALKANGAAARFVQPSLLQYKQRNFQAGATSLPSTANLKVRDIYGSTY